VHNFRRTIEIPGFHVTSKGARPNHIGDKRAGRIEERDGKLYAAQSAGPEQRAAV
jgi:hypothetical protein